MNLSKTNALFSFGQFRPLSGNAYNAVEFGWPVKAWECYANKIESGGLDALALTVLELLNLRYLSLRQISDDLGISGELLNHIIDRELLSKGYCEREMKTFKVTDKGKEYLNGVNANEIVGEKVFGYMFQSLVDDDFFPFFYEGTLPDPEPRYSKDGLHYLDSKKQGDFKVDSAELSGKINRAYHKYGYIYHKSKEISDNPIYDENFFVDADDDIEERDFDFDESDAAETGENFSEKAKKEFKNLKNARIKLLKTRPKEIYVKFRLYCLKDEPDFFQINSPFEENETKWYSEAFARMRNDANVLFGQTEDSMESLDVYCKNVSAQMYIDIPELKGLNPEKYMARTYPEIKNSSLSKKLKRDYLRLIRQQIHAKHGEGNEADVVMNIYRILEFMLKRHIARTDHNKVVTDYFNIVNDEYEIQSMEAYFSIPCGCKAFENEKKNLKYPNFKRQSIMSHFWNGRTGNSLLEKYYYLVFDAYNGNGKSGFAKALKADKKIIQKLDFINQKRNEFAGHDGFIDQESVAQIEACFKELSSVLVSNFDNR